jgi:hypothetical protein
MDFPKHNKASTLLNTGKCASILPEIRNTAPFPQRVPAPVYVINQQGALGPPTRLQIVERVITDGADSRRNRIVKPHSMQCRQKPRGASAYEKTSQTSQQAVDRTVRSLKVSGHAGRPHAAMCDASTPYEDTQHEHTKDGTNKRQKAQE